MGSCCQVKSVHVIFDSIELILLGFVLPPLIFDFLNPLLSLSFEELCNRVHFQGWSCFPLMSVWHLSTHFSLLSGTSLPLTMP